MKCDLEIIFLSGDELSFNGVTGLNVSTSTQLMSFTDAGGLPWSIPLGAVRSAWVLPRI